MKKILITGGAGFIGGHLVGELQDFYEIVVLDDLSTGSLENLRDVKCQFVEGSILDTALLAGVVGRCDFVVHLAGMTSVEESIQCPDECWEQNLTGLIRVAEAAEKHQVEKLVFASSSAVYGNTPQPLKSETDFCQPASPYAQSKFEAENHLRKLSESGRLRSVSLRLFNVFGPRQSSLGSYSPVIPRLIDHAMNHQPIELHGGGSQTRDFVHVRDVARAFRLALESDKIEGVMNVGTGEATRIKGLLETVMELTSSRSMIRSVERRKGDVDASLAETSIARKFGFDATRTLRAGLLEMIHDHRAT